MTERNSHHLTYASDLNGFYLVGVRLSNAPERTVWLYRPDYEVLTQIYGTSEWLMLRRGRTGRPYVGIYVNSESRRLLSVARAIVGERSSRRIGCVDDDFLNLRRSNIYFTPVEG